MKNKYDLKIRWAKFSPVLHLAGAVAWGTALVTALLGGLLLLPATDTQADGPDTAHIVIQFDEHTTIVRPISFTAPISGLAALQMTGLTQVISTTSFGSAVCSIEFLA